MTRGAARRRGDGSGRPPADGQRDGAARAVLVRAYGPRGAGRIRQ
ncbi:hypothetical protein [Streptomyces macrosporus]